MPCMSFYVKGTALGYGISPGPTNNQLFITVKNDTIQFTNEKSNFMFRTWYFAHNQIQILIKGSYGHKRKNQLEN